MKSRLVVLLSTVILMVACNDRARFLDLSTGEPVDLRKDENSGLMVNSETGMPVRVYVDRESNDTIWGNTGKVVNGKLVKSGDGEWLIKVDGDEYKAKSDDLKIKSEGGEQKVKGDDYKKKVEEDGDVKIKKGDKTIKIDGETGERKVKKED
jgi:hypothetical protein